MSSAGLMQLSPKTIISFRRLVLSPGKESPAATVNLRGGGGHGVKTYWSPPFRLTPDLAPFVLQVNVAEGPRRPFSSWIRSLSQPPPPPRHKRNDGGRGQRFRSSAGERELGETTTMVQEGLEIQEVPLAVLKQEAEICEEDSHGVSKPYIVLDKREEEAFVEGFNNFNTPQQILKMLDTIPTQEVTPFVSLGILKKLFELENNFGFRNEGMSWTVSSENSVLDTFARTAIVTRLIDTIISTEETSVLLAALGVLKSEKPLENANSYRDKLFQEVLRRVTEGKFSLPQVCEAVITLGIIEFNTKKPLPNNLIDKLWIGIFEKSESIDVSNITLLFQVLPHFKKSRRLVLNLAEKKLLSLWWSMDTKIVSKICEILLKEKWSKRTLIGDLKNPSECVGVSNRALSALSQCTNLNMHKITEEELFTIVRAFHVQNFCDTSFEKALNKYMKARCLKISDPKVVAAILDYAKKFHIRSANILEAAAEFVVMHKAANMSPPQMTSVVTAFGYLDFEPPNGIRFWQIVESFLNEKFIQFTPKDIIEVLLSCVYLKKFPLNFVNLIFSPYFLDRVHGGELDSALMQNLRSRLKLLDSALTIECPSKHGPMLPKDFSHRSVFIDGRILRMGNWLQDVVRETLGVKCFVEKFVILPSLPLNSLYIADLLISNTRRFEADRHNYLKNRINSRFNSCVPLEQERDLLVVLIHISEHFSRDGENLIGSEVMRIRHLKSLGLQVATVSYNELSELKVHPTALRDYLKERISMSGYIST